MAWFTVKKQSIITNEGPVFKSKATSERHQLGEKCPKWRKRKLSIESHLGFSRVAVILNNGLRKGWCSTHR